MSPALGRASMMLAVWAAVLVGLTWGRLPPRWRRLLALLASASGLVFLVLALNMAGQREAPSTSAFLIGPGYVTGWASASASLPYYVMTGVFLALGTLGLALPERVARQQSRHWLATAIGLSMLITLVRFLLEQAAAPPGWARAVGITALVPLIGVVFALCLRAEGRGLRALAGALLVYGVSVRAWVALFYVVATSLQISSTHYNLHAVTRVHLVTGQVRTFAAGSAEQVLALAVLPQLVVWPLYTLLVGFVLGSLVWLAPPLRPGRRDSGVHTGLEVAPARQDS